MTIPPTAFYSREVMDPKEVLDWVLNVGPTSAHPLLEPGEAIESWTLVLSAESVAAGLSIMSGGSREAHPLIGAEAAAAGLPDNTAIKLWLQIADGYQLDPMFSGSGTALSMELTIVTNSVPSRTRQRTYVVRIAQL